MATRHRSRPTARARPQPARTGPTAQSLYRRPLRFEPLEDRRLLALVTVTTLDDSVDLNDGLTSLREAIFATNLVAGADTIVFAPALTENGPATILLTQGELKIADSLTIEGLGAELLTIDASGSDTTPDLQDGLGSRIFNIDDGTDSRMAVSINRLTLTGGDVTGNGGAINSAENLTMTSAVVDDNAAFSGVAYGGGVHSTGSLLLIDCRIVNNLASGRASYGAISALAGITIRNSEISSNQGRTGGVYVREGDVEIADTAISSNIGVGLEIDSGNHTVSVLRTTISENVSSVGRGGMMLTVSNGGTALVSDSTFVGNTSPFRSGGGAYISTTAGGKAIVDHTRFIENRGAFGGGMALRGSVQVINSEFRGNVATDMYGDGGGLWVSSGNHSISNSTFVNNKAERDGGAVFVSGSGSLISNTHLVGNTIVANRAGDRGGGVAVSATSGIVTINETILQENTAGGSGGGAWIRADESSRVRVENSTIDANMAHVDGGGVAILALGQGEATLFQSTVSGNAANGSGGGLSITTSTGRAVVSHSTITLNRADANRNDFGLESGGGISATATGTGRLHVTHSIVAGNRVPANFPPDDFRNVNGNLDLFYSLIGSSNGSGLMPTPVGSSDANGNLIGGAFSGFIVPQLGPLVNNGGPTDTHALLPGSPAIDAGDPAAVAGENGVPFYDQRGEPFSRIFGGRIDIGAFEVQPNPLPGDYNFNGVVDAADSVVWRKTLGSKIDLRADGDGNGQVDEADRAIWASNFGNTRQPIRTGAPATEEAAVQPLVMASSKSQTAEPSGGIADGASLIPVTVTTLLDTVDFNDGLTSLREAIFATNLVAGADTIDFAPDLTENGPATILLTQGELRITDSLTIEGPGANLLTIDASGNDPTPDINNGDGSRVFNIDDATSNVIDVAISKLRITGGDIQGDGGAIRSVERLVVSHAVLAKNAAAKSGGAIYAAASGTGVRIEDVSITSNSAQDGGGLSLATDLAGFASIERSTISRNSASRFGGGVYARSQNSEVQIVGCAIANNTAFRGGGARLISVNSAAIAVQNTTISENRSEFDGGGVEVIVLTKGSVALEQAIISNNSCTGGAGGIAFGQDGPGDSVITLTHSLVTNNTSGIQGYGEALTLVLDHTIAAGNQGDSGVPRDLNPSAQVNLSSRYSLIGYYSGTKLLEAPVGTPDANGNLIGGPVHGAIDPLLGPLADNGGPPLTHALLPGSPAINAGDLNALAGVGGVPLYDQRGESFDRVFGGRIDIGAFEYQELSDLNLLVDTLVDEPNGNYSRGDLSLCEAVELANLWPGPDTIRFDPTLTANGPATIVLTKGELAITDSLTIEGPGANLLTIDASGNDPTPDMNNGDGSRIFNIDDGTPNLIDISLAGLTLTGGDVADRGGAILSRENLSIAAVTVTLNSANNEDPLVLGLGGGISQDDGHLTVTECVVSNNSAGLGGGIYVESGRLIVTDSSVVENTALSGAGLYNVRGDAEISRTTIRDNLAPGGFSLGGGIYTSGGLSVTATTISGNSAAYGGGLFSRTNVAGTNRTSILNSTISGNTAFARGGGVRNALGITVIEHSTITANTAPLGQGSGVASRGYDSAHTSVRATIVAGNTNSDIDFASGDFDSFQSVGENLIGSGNALAAFAAPLDQTGVADPMLGPLADNGGPTQTHALLAGSPAINAGDLNAQAGVSGVPLYDQRGEPFDRIFGGRIDIGAYEYQAPSDLNLVVDTLADESDGDYGQGDLSLREAIELANLWRGADTIDFASALTAAGPATILLTHGELKITDSLTIAGPGADLLTIDASGSDPTPVVQDSKGGRIFNIDDGADVLIEVSLSHLTLTGAVLSSNQGGVICSLENLSLAHMSVTNNSSGAQALVANIGGSLVVSACTISDNYGGAISSMAGEVRIANTAISGNRPAPFDTNMVSVVDGNLRVSQSEISGNVFAVGVYMQGGSAEFAASTISDNYGGIQAFDADVFIANSAISDNGTTVSGSLTGWGGIAVANGSLIATQSRISGNVVMLNRGSGIATVNSQVTISDTVVSNNLSWATPGISIKDGDAEILRSIVSDNVRESGNNNSCAGIQVQDANLRIIDSTITHNSGSRSSAVQWSGTAAFELSNSIVEGSYLGVSIFADGGSATISHCTIAENTRGVSAQARNNGSISIADTAISKNLGGGGVFIRTSVGGIATITRSTISGNSASSRGGGVYVESGEVTISDSLITGNGTEIAGSWDGGGGVFLDGEAIATIRGSIVSQNYSGAVGGGICSIGNLTILDTTISANESRSHGGGAAFYGLVTVTDSRISNNKASGYGGGIALFPNVPQLVLRTTVSDNTAAGDGGGIYAGPNSLPSQFSVTDSTISGNTSSGRGGGLSLISRGTITGCLISENSADKGGGLSALTVDLHQSTVSGNSATTGGGIYSAGVRVEFSTIAFNTASEFGGGAFVRAGSLPLTNSIVAANSALAGSDLTGLIGTSLSPKLSLVGTNRSSGLAEAPIGSPDTDGNLIGGSIHGFIDPRLGPLADNGGPTPTHALLPGSPAINAGDPAAVAGENGVPLYDQRGAPFARVYGGRIDIGAFEAQPNPLPGDYDFDGVVDAADLVVWRRTRGFTTDLRADGNEDGVIDEADRAIWMANFGESRGGERAMATSTTVITPPVQQPPAEPGAVSFRVTAANRTATAKDWAASVPSAVVRQDAALLAWLATRTERDELRLSASNQRSSDMQDDQAVTPRADVLDYVFDTVGATAEL